MAFKEIAMFSSLVVVTIISYNVLEGNAVALEPLIDQDYVNVKASLYNLGETLMNLMDDSQTLNDMQREFYAGKVDYSAVERAKNDLINTKNQLFLQLMKYLAATNNFEPAVNYLKTDPRKIYKAIEDLENYKDNIENKQADLMDLMNTNIPPVAVAA